MCNGTAANSPSFRLLAHDPEDCLSIQRDFGTGNALYEQIATVRLGAEGERAEFEFDRYSYHYGLFVDDQPVGTMTATRLADGQIDCAHAYPPGVLRTFADEIYSTCKFRIHRSRCSSMKTLRMMVRAVWRDQLSLGSRLVLINAEKNLVPFYRRMGFHVIAGSDFVHPVLETQSVALMMSADPTRRSFFSDLFEDLCDPLWLEIVLEHCHQNAISSPTSTQDQANAVWPSLPSSPQGIIK
ncbi:N-acyl amino acid synthase FeeM domain-containing protein [Aporhodopirellula aestuarii]|uniref:N-acyl amino acid synthase FeeM catalytic core domain-containing protein n=1 Tax=Aporhodopirellula aestuarii TaxID=2950107 RepID=A0ABT0UB96_9BACT|nr:hypothetical protein [Aporhodopirellula aestuarii]MCM2374129.1 hypothetical protein [Aporhodopirellula aestuarii]